MLLLGIVTFAVLFWKLYDIQIRQHSVLQEKAIEQQDPQRRGQRLPRHRL